MSEQVICLGLASTVGTILFLRIVSGPITLCLLIVGVVDETTVENVTFLFNTSVAKGKTVASGTVGLDRREIQGK